MAEARQSRIIRRGPFAIATSAATLAVALTGCGGNGRLSEGDALKLLKAQPVGADVYEDGREVQHHDPVAEHQPQDTFWGSVDYCNDDTGQLEQIALYRYATGTALPGQVYDVQRVQYTGAQTLEVCKKDGVNRAEMAALNLANQAIAPATSTTTTP